MFSRRNSFKHPFVVTKKKVCLEEPVSEFHERVLSQGTVAYLESYRLSCESAKQDNTMSLRLPVSGGNTLMYRIVSCPSSRPVGALKENTAGLPVKLGLTSNHKSTVGYRSPANGCIYSLVSK